jgi:hypothetical protein
MAARATAMATSRRPASRWVSAVLAAALLGAVGVPLTSAALAPSGSRATSAGTRALEARAFSWLKPGQPPRSWTHATIPSGGATLFYPPAWHAIPGDQGTVTAALRDSRGLYRGYLNVTPREGAERLAGWAAFRLRRNQEEGDTRVHAAAAAEGLRFAGARGSCVIDTYRSRVGFHTYRELACIIAGARFTDVFVGAALLSDWATLSPVIERAASTLIER